MDPGEAGFQMPRNEEELQQLQNFLNEMNGHRRSALAQRFQELQNGLKR